MNWLYILPLVQFLLTSVLSLSFCPVLSISPLPCLLFCLFFQFSVSFRFLITCLNLCLSFLCLVHIVKLYQFVTDTRKKSHETLTKNHGFIFFFNLPCGGEVTSQLARVDGVPPVKLRWRKILPRVVMVADSRSAASAGEEEYTPPRLFGNANCPLSSSTTKSLLMKLASHCRGF